MSSHTRRAAHGTHGKVCRNATARRLPCRRRVLVARGRPSRQTPLLCRKNCITPFQRRLSLLRRREIERSRGTAQNEDGTQGWRAGCPKRFYIAHCLIYPVDPGLCVHCINALQQKLCSTGIFAVCFRPPRKPASSHIGAERRLADLVSNSRRYRLLKFDMSSCRASVAVPLLKLGLLFNSVP